MVCFWPASVYKAQLIYFISFLSHVKKKKEEKKNNNRDVYFLSVYVKL